MELEGCRELSLIAAGEWSMLGPGRGKSGIPSMKTSKVELEGSHELLLVQIYAPYHSPEQCHWSLTIVLVQLQG